MKTRSIGIFLKTGESMIKKMTNREYLIAQLSDENFIDDSGASYEATIYNSISCPYLLGDERALCNDVAIDKVDRNMCFKCKEKWLNSEIDE